MTDDPYDVLEWKNEVYDVLVAEVGADPGLRSQFLIHWPECLEFRFMGSLGMGGKIWHHRHCGTPYVNCYPEDITDERRDAITRANNALAKVGNGS